MPELTPKLGIKKPLGNETISRAAFNENWDIIDTQAQKNIAQGATAPASPAEADLWIDTSTSPNALKRYTAGNWVKVGAVTPGDLGAVANAGSTPSIQAGPDASKPSPGTAGRLYVATDTQIIYRDTGTAWQKVGAVKWSDIQDKPSSFAPSIHGNEAHDPDLALASDLNAHVASKAQDNVHGLGNIPMVSTEAKTYYIDATNGNDANDGLTPGTAFKTWAKVERLIPRFILHPYIVYIIGNLPEVISLGNRIIGTSSVVGLQILGYTSNPSAQVVSGIQLYSIISGANTSTDNGRLAVRYLQSSGCINVTNCVGIFLQDLQPRYDSGSYGAINVSLSNVYVSACDFGTDVVTKCIRGWLARILSQNNTGQGKSYGLVAEFGTTIAKAGTQPTGSVANEYIYGGGEIR